MIPNERPVSASELAEFVYCNRAWWLKSIKTFAVNRTALRNQNAGNIWHWRQGKTTAGADGLSWAGYVVLAMSIFLLAMWIWGATR